MMPALNSFQLVIASIVFLIALMTYGCGGVSVRLVVPKAVRAGSSAILVCQFDLKGKELYSVKWYRGSYEFFRFMPREESPAMAFPVPGINVDVAGSNAHQVTLLKIPRYVSGKFSCEVSAEAPEFKTSCDSANLTIIDFRLNRPILKISSREYRPGSDLSINCTVEPTQPPPVISFYVNSRKVDRKWVSLVGPGLAHLSPSSLDSWLPNPRPPVAYSPADPLPPPNPTVPPLWLRCEASLPDVYHLSSLNIPLIVHPPVITVVDSGRSIPPSKTVIFLVLVFKTLT